MHARRTLLAMALALWFAPSVQAITVPCDTSALITAIQDLNAGAGGTLDLTSCVYAFAAPHNAWYGPNALPPITTPIVIEGHGAELKANGASPFRLLYVAGGLPLPAGSLTLRNLTLSGGRAKGGDAAFGGEGAGMGGAIFNQGALVLEAVTLMNNTAQGGNDTLLNGYAGGGMGEDAQFYVGGGFGAGFVGGSGGFGGPGGTNSGGGGGGFRAGDNGAAGNAGPEGAAGGGLGGLGQSTADGGRGGDVISSRGAGGGGVGGGGGGGLGSGNGSGGDFGFGGASGPGTGGSGGFGGGGGWSGGGFGTTGGYGGFGGGGGGSIGGVAGQGGFGAGNGSPNSGHGGGGGGFGGAIFNHAGTVTATNITLSGNSAVGGVVESGQSGTPSRNGSGLGGAVFNLNGSVSLKFSTIAFNTVQGSNGASVSRGPGSGAAVYSLAFGNRIADGGASTSMLTLIDSIVFNNTGATSAVVNQVVNGAQQNAASATRYGANIVQSWSDIGVASSSGPAPITLDPLLQVLANNGGDTLTHALTAASPAIDAAQCGRGTSYDQRGFFRGHAEDLGSFELGAASTGEITRIFADTFDVVGAPCPP